jgi:hypothetical protein
MVPRPQSPTVTRNASWVPFSAIVEISLTVLGMGMMVLALPNFLHSRANIDRDAFHPPAHFVVLLTILTVSIPTFRTLSDKHHSRAERRRTWSALVLSILSGDFEDKNSEAT